MDVLHIILDDLRTRFGDSERYGRWCDYRFGHHFSVYRVVTPLFSGVLMDGVLRVWREDEVTRTPTNPFPVPESARVFDLSEPGSLGAFVAFVEGVLAGEGFLGGNGQGF